MVLLLVLSPTSGQGQAYAGKPAAAVLDHYHLKYADLEMEDEPPGKLQAFAFVRPEDKKRVVVRLQYTPKLFSSDRKWDLQAVRAATILEVAVEPR
jgi:hypothetical protein